MCFLQLDHVNVYYGQDYRSKYKAPTDYCLALKVNFLYCHILCSGTLTRSTKTAADVEMCRTCGILSLAVKNKNNSLLFGQHPQIQKKSQYIKYLCCDDVRTLHQWVNGIRIAKVGSKLSFCSVLRRKIEIFLVMHIHIYVFFQLYAVWKTAVWKLPGGYEENRGSI